MARMLKRWESPRREGRNDKGKGGSARQKQLKKRNQMLRKKLQGGSNQDDKRGKDSVLPSLFLSILENARVAQFHATVVQSIFLLGDRGLRSGTSVSNRTNY